MLLDWYIVLCVLVLVPHLTLDNLAVLHGNNLDWNQQIYSTSGAAYS